MKIIFFIFFMIFPMFVYANNVQSNVVVDGSYYDWNVYYINDLSGEKKCYIASFAKDSVGNYTKERKPYIMITYFKAKEIEEISIFAGYDYKNNSSIYVGVDNKQYRMLTNGKMAWAKNSEEDKMLIQEVVKAKTIRTRGETLTGEYTVDTYSTKGLARAYQRMRQLCEDY